MKTIYSQSQDFQAAVTTYKQLNQDSNKAALEGCMLLARINGKLLDEFDGNPQSKGYKKVASTLIEGTGLKYAQYRRDVQIGNYLIVNIETKPELWTLPKTAIYKTYIHVPKSLPKISKPAIVSDSSNEIEFYKDILRQIRQWTDTGTRIKWEGLLNHLGIDSRGLSLD